MDQRTRRLICHIMTCLIVLVGASSYAADGPYWGDFQQDKCTKPGYRQYSAILWGIPSGASWEKTCTGQSATINGQHFAHPDRCVNTLTNMWGQFDVPDDSCKAQWGGFERGGCTAIGKRKYSAQILTVPQGKTEKDACETTPATVQGQSFVSPSRCNNKEGTEEWGEFNVSDNTCEAHWGNFQPGECATTGEREYSAQLFVPDGLSWEGACAATSATVAGQSFQTPTQCENRGVAGEWGKFDVNDAACEVHLLPSSWPNPNPNPNAPIWGFADTHNHQFAYLGFGGKFVAGKVFDPSPDGIKTALPWCNPNHGPGGIGDILGSIITTSYGVRGAGVGHKVGGYPQFDGWPVWNSVTHQQAYYQWLKRAHAGGLQLMVMMAVNNEMLCEAMGSTHAPLGCNDMDAVDRQLAKARELESYIAETDGGWYKIVYSAEEARQAIHKGQLAIVLGIEVANLFNCGRVPNHCTNDVLGRQYVSAQLRKYYGLGVRHLFPIHATDDEFGGTAVFEIVYQLNNILFGRGPFTVYDCSAQGGNYSLDAPAVTEQPLFRMLDGRFASAPVPTNPPKAECNAQGLTDLGKFLVEEMMNLHMIIDVDHMSWKAIDETLKLAEAHHYPAVISGHSGYINTSTYGKRHEGQKNEKQLQWIADLGGMAGTIAAQGVTANAGGTGGGISAWGSSVPNDCSNSSKTFAQAYLYAVETMGGPQKARVALATDFMGAIYQPGPRFGNDACYGGNDGERNAQLTTTKVQYPFTLPGMTVPLYQSRACDGRDFSAATSDCKRTFDFNVDGLAHVGMLPDLIQDLHKIGLKDDDLTPLFRSAESYISMWEKAERVR